jgi:hypothetical protein
MRRSDQSETGVGLCWRFKDSTLLVLTSSDVILMTSAKGLSLAVRIQSARVLSIPDVGHLKSVMSARS